MSQYSSVKTNTRVSVINNSPTITGVGTEWLANISVGDGFTVAGDGVYYDVAAIPSNTSITLSAPYQGATATSVHYTIHRDFTSPDNIPELNQGDIETGTIMRRLARVVQGKFTGAIDGGTY